MRSFGIRLIHGPNPGGVWDVALDESILRCTRENHGPLTFRLWQSMDPVLILPSSTSSDEEMLFQKCQKDKISVTHALSGRQPLLCGPGVLSFSIIRESKVLTSGGLETEIEELLLPIVQGLRIPESTTDTTISQGHIHGSNSLIGAYNTHYYFDYLLLQGMIIVHNNARHIELMTSRDETQFSPLESIRNDVEVRDLISAIVEEIQNHFGCHISLESTSVQEINLMNELYKWKYSTDEWIFHHSAPLSLGRVLLEAYLAYPPTSRCREIMAIVDDLSETHRDKVEVRTWLRGRGLASWLKGVPPGLLPSGGVIQASKRNIVPAIIVEGRITHELTVPTYDDLRRIVDEAYSQTYEGTSK